MQIHVVLQIGLALEAAGPNVTAIGSTSLKYPPTTSIIWMNNRSNGACFGKPDRCGACYSSGRDARHASARFWCLMLPSSWPNHRGTSPAKIASIFAVCHDHSTPIPTLYLSILCVKKHNQILDLFGQCVWVQYGRLPWQFSFCSYSSPTCQS